MSAVRFRWDEDTAWQWSLLALWGGFVVGSVVGLIGVAFLIVRVSIPERRWWAILDAIHYGMLAILFGGTGTAVVAGRTVDWFAARTIVYHCGRCGRPRTRRGRCRCLPPIDAKPGPTRWERAERWLQTNGPRALALAAAIVPVAFAGVAWAARTRPIRSWAAETAMFHALLCILLAALIGLADLLPGHRVRLWHATWKPPATGLAVYGIIYVGVALVPC